MTKSTMLHLDFMVETILKLTAKNSRELISDIVLCNRLLNREQLTYVKKKVLDGLRLQTQ